MRTKEFLGKHKVPFLSRNILSDEGALEELLALGTRQLPVVSRGKDWVNGQSLKDVARIAGINLGTVKHLPQPELVRRIDLILEGAARFFRQFPEEHLGDQLPGRPRSLAQLTWHLFNVVDAFLEHEQGIRLMEDAFRRLPKDGSTRQDILDYGADVRRRFAAWWDSAKNRTDWTDKANVYYGDVSRHEFLERTTWHSGQHSRQLMWALNDRYHIAPDRPLGPEMWQGLPMPEQIWDG
ncbi:MAG TPA: DinB family protein [Hyphomicrobiaceae bacterium]|nr:DinB family protein [Hyphomicrobiaceae bacterium]